MGNENAALAKKKGYDDLPAQADQLGLEQYFTGLARFIQNCPTPMTIAIQGGWGSGKTTAMKLIQKELDKTNGTLQIDFNTWQYARAARGVLFIPLLLELVRVVDKAAEDAGLAKGYYKEFDPKKALLKISH